MPAIQTREKRKNGGGLVPIVLGGAVVVTVAGLWFWRRSRAKGGGPGPAVLVASPGGPTIS